MPICRFEALRRDDMSRGEQNLHTVCTIGIWNKLKSKKGSALLVALLFSLICLLLGVVILSSGVASNGRIVNAAKAEQSYYLAASMYRQFDYETTDPYTVDDPDVPTEGMSFELRSARSEDFDFENAIADSPQGPLVDPDEQTNRHRLTTLKPFIASALNDTMNTGVSQTRTLTYNIGSGSGDGETYSVTVVLSVNAEDYSIYLDITDIVRGSGGSAEHIGLPSLHTIVLQTKSVVPLAAEEEADRVHISGARFTYHKAKFVQMS